MARASTLLSSSTRRKSLTVRGVRACPLVPSSPFLMTFASTSQIYATSEFAILEKFCAWTIPRPLTPQTAMRTVSLGDCPRPMIGAARMPSPATVVCLTKSRRSMSLMFISLLEDPNLDIAKPHYGIVILEHDPSEATHRKPGWILRVFALRECRGEGRRTELEGEDAGVVDHLIFPTLGRVARLHRRR